MAWITIGGRHEYHTWIDEKTILCKLNLIIEKLDLIMALTQQQFNELVARLDAVTNDIAADYQKLLDEIQAGNISDESVAAAKANIEKLEALGASVENPVPPVEEPPAEPTPTPEG